MRVFFGGYSFKATRTMDGLLKLVVVAQFIAFSFAFYDPEIRLEKRRDDGYTDFSPEEVDAIVARHNYHRANTKPSAANMLEMVSLKTIKVLPSIIDLVSMNDLNMQLNG